MQFASVKELNEHVERESQFLRDVRAEINKVIVGQDRLIDRMLIALLANGHILLEGVPGLAKTLLVKTISDQSRPIFRACNSRPIYCQPILSAQRFTIHAQWSSVCGRGQFLPIWC